MENLATSIVRKVLYLIKVSAGLQRNLLGKENVKTKETFKGN